MRTWNWATIPGEPLGDGIVRQMIHGERLMICRLTIPPGTVAPAHRHANEQITIVEKGRAPMLDEEVVLLDIFSPVPRGLSSEP